VDGVRRSVHVAGESLVQDSFVEEVASMLEAAADHAAGLCLEVSEADAVRQPGWRQAFAVWKPWACAWGWRTPASTRAPGSRRAGSGWMYLEVDGRFLRGVGRDEKLREYLVQLVATARGLGVPIYAEGLDRQEDLRAAWELGFDGATGAAVRAGALSRPGAGPPAQPPLRCRRCARPTRRGDGPRSSARASPRRCEGDLLHGISSSRKSRASIVSGPGAKFVSRSCAR
jgi:hypothetical protein